ncbi:MAG: hypothetical protein AMXMBFR77_28520 [Phycisphaerales bacterium]|nr:hypothetical protein [Leptolyngbya sp.]MCQ3941209.1 hypothetical protein [cyanobacterium CYA1]MDL1905493.1 hypothetical protein [Synechococcales cyanobacterium CNB]
MSKRLPAEIRPRRGGHRREESPAVEAIDLGNLCSVIYERDGKRYEHKFKRRPRVYVSQAAPGVLVASPVKVTRRSRTVYLEG